MTSALTAEGVQIMTSMPEAFAALIAQDTVRLGRIVRDAGAKAE